MRLSCYKELKNALKIKNDNFSHCHHLVHHTYADSPMIFGHRHNLWKFTDRTEILWHVGDMSPTFPTNVSCKNELNQSAGRLFLSSLFLQIKTGFWLCSVKGRIASMRDGIAFIGERFCVLFSSWMVPLSCQWTQGCQTSHENHTLDLVDCWHSF